MRVRRHDILGDDGIVVQTRISFGPLGWYQMRTGLSDDLTVYGPFRCIFTRDLHDYDPGGESEGFVTDLSEVVPKIYARRMVEELNSLYPG